MLWLILCLVSAASSIASIVITKELLGSVRESKATASYFIFPLIFLTPLLPLVLSSSDYTLPLDLFPILLLGAALNLSATYVYMKAIKYGNLSVVVPIRNTTPLFVALLAVLFIAENVTLGTVAAMLFIMAGVFVLNHRKGEDRKSGAYGLKPAIYALTVAVMAAGVFVITKYSVSLMNPFLYAYVSSLLASVILISWLALNGRLQKFMGVVRAAPLAFLAIGLLTTIASLCVVYATSLEKASVVSAFLRVELLFGVVAGSIFFKETITKFKMVGAFLILIGLLILLL